MIIVISLVAIKDEITKLFITYLQKKDKKKLIYYVHCYLDRSVDCYRINLLRVFHAFLDKLR